MRSGTEGATDGNTDVIDLVGNETKPSMRSQDAGLDIYSMVLDRCRPIVELSEALKWAKTWRTVPEALPPVFRRNEALQICNGSP